MIIFFHKTNFDYERSKKKNQRLPVHEIIIFTKLQKIKTHKVHKTLFVHKIQKPETSQKIFFPFKKFYLLLNNLFGLQKSQYQNLMFEEKIWSHNH